MAVTDVRINLGPRMLVIEGQTMGTCDNLEISIAEASEEEVELMKSANEIRLVRMIGEGGQSEETGN